MTREQPVRSHRDLEVWRRAVDLAVACHALTRTFPPEERFGLARQLSRAAASVPANIAEGHGRRSRGDYARFLRIAHASLMEVDTHLELAHRLALAPAPQVASALALRAETGRMLGALIGRLRSPPPRS